MTDQQIDKAVIISETIESIAMGIKAANKDNKIYHFSMGDISITFSDPHTGMKSVVDIKVHNR